jgi:hypothetical protein
MEDDKPQAKPKKKNYVKMGKEERAESSQQQVEAPKKKKYVLRETDIFGKAEQASIRSLEQDMA